MGRNKATPPFPRLQSFLVSCTILKYYEPTMTCLMMLRKLSKSSLKYAKKHQKLIKGGTKSSALRLRELPETEMNEADLNRELGRVVDPFYSAYRFKDIKACINHVWKTEKLNHFNVICLFEKDQRRVTSVAVNRDVDSVGLKYFCFKYKNDRTDKAERILGRVAGPSIKESIGGRWKEIRLNWNETLTGFGGN